MGTESEYIIECDNLVKIYKTDETEVMALQGLDCKVSRGELMAIIGNSGSGKSTFLNMIGGLDRPTAGRLYVDGLDLFRLSERELVQYKRHTVGFVWQNNARNLIPYLPAWQNVQMPMLFSGKSGSESRKRAEELLELVGLGHKKKNKLGEMSGGEQQRVALARALVHNPDLVIADEPTGNIDPRLSIEIMELLKAINSTGTTVLVVTHEHELARRYAQRTIEMRNGVIVRDTADGKAGA